MKRFLCPIFLCLIFFHHCDSSSKLWMVLVGIEKCLEFDKAMILRCPIGERCRVPDDYKSCVINQTEDIAKSNKLKYDIHPFVVTEVVNVKKNYCAEKGQKYRLHCAPTVDCTEFKDYLACVNQYLFPRILG